MVYSLQWHLCHQNWFNVDVLSALQYPVVEFLHICASLVCHGTVHMS